MFYVPHWRYGAPSARTHVSWSIFKNVSPRITMRMFLCGSDIRSDPERYRERYTFFRDTRESREIYATYQRRAKLANPQSKRAAPRFIEKTLNRPLLAIAAREFRKFRWQTGPRGLSEGAFTWDRMLQSRWSDIANSYISDLAYYDGIACTTMLHLPPSTYV